MNDDSERKRDALATFLGVAPPAVSIRDNSFRCGQAEYLVLTDAEADAAAAQAVEKYVYIAAEFLEHKKEDANEALVSLIEATRGMEDFVCGVVMVLGRGHFLADWDGKEHKAGDYYIYRIN